MRREFRNPARLAVALAFGLLTASAASAQDPTPQPAPPAPAPAPAPAPDPQPAPEPAPAPEAPEMCEVVIDGASVPVNAEPVTVRAAFSRAIGETIKADISPESGIKVVSAKPVAEAPLTLELTLDTSAAAAGDWALALKGEEGACAGSISVLPATPPPSR